MLKLTTAVLSTTAITVLVTAPLAAQPIVADVHRISDAGVGEKIGTVPVSAAKRGLAIRVNISGIAKGPHGFHLHQNADCGAGMQNGKMSAGANAGPHDDPAYTSIHNGPGGTGHKGDLPVLIASDKGVKQRVVATRLTMADVVGRSLVIHANNDNFTDTPENGGSAARIACAVLVKKYGGAPF